MSSDHGVQDAARMAAMQNEAEEYDVQLLEALTGLCDALGVDTNIFDVDDNRSSPLYIIGYLKEAVKSAFEKTNVKILLDQESDKPDDYFVAVPLTQKWTDPFPQTKRFGDMLIRKLVVSGGKFEMSGEFSDKNIEGQVV